MGLDPPPAEALGESPFNYDDYTAARFVHYYQQLAHVLPLEPSRVLEVGPGDHTVTDFLRRKGIHVDTADADPTLRPTFLVDVRDLRGIEQRYDVVLASEVLEHLPFEELQNATAQLASLLSRGGTLVISVPYSTIRLLPARRTYGRLLSPEGRLHTGLPLSVAHRVRHPVRGVALPAYPSTRVDVHHWDLGYRPSSRRRVRALLRQQFEIVQERTYIGTNCVFWELRPHAGQIDR